MAAVVTLNFMPVFLTKGFVWKNFWLFPKLLLLLLLLLLLSVVFGFENGYLLIIKKGD
jgi:hypothetical protein